ncbi:High mobility group B protein 13 [Linum grandiflorum]
MQMYRCSMAEGLGYPSVLPPPSSSDTDQMKENRNSISSTTKGRSSKAGNSSRSRHSRRRGNRCLNSSANEAGERDEEMLKEKGEMLKARKDELEKKLQKLKEFKPTLNFRILKDNERDNKSKNKKDGAEMKWPSSPYILWIKDQWAEGAKWKPVTAEEKKPYEEKYWVEKEAYLQVIVVEKRETEAMRLLEAEQKEAYLQVTNKSSCCLDVSIFRSSCAQLLTHFLNHRKERDPSKPKQPISAFFIFSNERRVVLATKNKSDTEVAKINFLIAKKEKYLIEIDVYKLKKEEEAMNVRKKEEELLRISI